MSPTAITANVTVGWPKPPALLTQALGAVVWGVFFSVAPIAEVLLFGCVLWMPLLLSREVARYRRHGFWAGFVVRCAVVVVVVRLASWGPFSWEDRFIVGPFPARPMTLKEVSEHVRIIRVSDASASAVVVLPASTMSLRELLDEIEDQTGRRASWGTCGNMKTIAFGAPPMGGVHL